MERKFQINLADYIVGPEELDLLLKEWLKTPRPKTINQLARMYLTHLWEIQTGFLPYDRRTSYSKGAKIAIILAGQTQPRPAKVTKVSNKAFRDSDGFIGDIITVHLLSQTAKLSNRETADFLANYQGEEKAGRAVKALQIIKEKDEAEVIPKILLAISDDKRFFEFEGKWLPKELLIDVSGKKNNVEKIIAESKQALSTDVILEKVQAIDKEEELNQCLGFSLNYFLSKDKRFICVYNSVAKWNLRQIQKSGQVKVNEKRQWTITIKPEWLEEGVLVVPRKLASYMEGINSVHIIYDQVEEVLPYEENRKIIAGIDNFYSTKAIADGDKVHLRLQGLEPTKLFVSSRWWQRRRYRLLQIEPADLRWEHSSLRDCIIVTLAKFRTPAHYREIYTEIAIHKNVSYGAILGTLSRYSPALFIHVGRGTWGLAGWAEQEGRPKSEVVVSQEAIRVSNEIWKAVAVIEDNDYVYKLLKRIRKPSSFDEICSRLADHLRVDVQGLRATGFLRADDKRLRRLDDGTWALAEWFSRDDETELTEPCSEEISKYSLLWLLAIIVLILLLIGTASVLIWLFIYGR